MQVFDVSFPFQFQAIFIHITETACLKYFIDLFLTKGKLVMFFGNDRVEKTVFLGNRLILSYVWEKIQKIISVFKNPSN